MIFNKKFGTLKYNPHGTDKGSALAGLHVLELNDQIHIRNSRSLLT